MLKKLIEGDKMDYKSQDDNKYQYRHVSFKSRVYSLNDGRRLEIIPIPFWDTSTYNNLISMGIEKYFIIEHELEIENIKKETLENLDQVLSTFCDELRRLI